MATNEYVVEYAKTGRASCKNTKCKKNIAAGDVRIGKVLEEIKPSKNSNFLFIFDSDCSQSIW